MLIPQIQDELSREIVAYVLENGSDVAKLPTIRSNRQGLYDVALGWVNGRGMTGELKRTSSRLEVVVAGVREKDGSLSDYNLLMCLLSTRLGQAGYLAIQKKAELLDFAILVGTSSSDEVRYFKIDHHLTDAVQSYEHLIGLVHLAFVKQMI